MIKILAIDFIRRNTEYLKIMRGLYENHVEILKSMKAMDQEMDRLKKENEELKETIKILKLKYER